MQVAKRAVVGQSLRSYSRAMLRSSHGNVEGLAAVHRKGNAAATILSAVLADPSGYGRVVRKSETLVSAIIEESAAHRRAAEINEINSAIYCFTLEKLWPALAR